MSVKIRVNNSLEQNPKTNIWCHKILDENRLVEGRSIVYE